MDPEQQQIIHPEQRHFERGNFYNESEPFKRGNNEYVYRARVEEVEPGRYKVYVYEFRKDTWILGEGFETRQPVGFEAVEKIYDALKLTKEVEFQVHDFTEETQEEKAEETKEEDQPDKQEPTPEQRAGETPKNIENPFKNKPTPEANANATPGEGNDKGVNNTPENRADKNEEADSNTEIFVKSTLRTVAIGAAAMAGVALVALFSAPVALALGIGLGVKALADSFLSHANEALDKDRDVFSYDTISGTISGALPIDIRAAIATSHGFDPITGEEISPQMQAQATGNIVGGVALAVAGGAAAMVKGGGQGANAARTRKYLDGRLSQRELTARMKLLEKTKNWAETLPDKDKAIAKKIIADHESGQLYGIRKEGGGVLTLEKHRDTKPTLDTLKMLFPNKPFNVRNKGGKGYQGAHLNPATYMKQTKGYDRSEAKVAILPTKFRGRHAEMPHWAPDVHRRMDAVWKMVGLDMLKQGRTTITAQELLNANIKAINDAPHLSPTAKQQLVAEMIAEFMQMTGGNMSFQFKISSNKGY